MKLNIMGKTNTEGEMIMKLYLSSYKLGNNIDELKKWIEEKGNKIVLIPNSRDVYEDSERLRRGINDNVEMLREIGFDVEVISLKKYFGNPEQLEIDFSKYNAFFAIGGNSFALRKAMQLSGFDEYLKKQVDNPNFLYSGYSAGICVLSPSLLGLELVDPPINPYNDEDVIYEGIGLLDYVLVPHYKSNHSESEKIDLVVKYMLENNIKFQPLRDGEIIVEDYSKNKIK